MTRWLDEQTARLTQLWTEGMSCAEIGKRLGVTRNAVIGKVHRLKLSARARTPRDAGAAGGHIRKQQAATVRRGRKKKAVPKIGSAVPANPTKAERDARSELRPKRAPTPQPTWTAPVVATGERPTILTIGAGQCRWPFGDAPYTFCGYKTEGGATYCAEHQRIAYKPAVPKRKATAVVLEDMLAKNGVRYREDAWTAAYIREYSERLGIKLTEDANG